MIKPKTTFVMVYGSLLTGGIETLIVRMANFLAKNRFDVVVCCGEGGMLSALPQSAHVLNYKNTAELCKKLDATDASIVRHPAEVIIVSFDPISAAVALQVERRYSSRTRTTHLAGVFHPRAYFMTGERMDRVLLNHGVARAIGYSHLFFMNEECRTSHAKHWDVDLDGSPIATLPIDVAKNAWVANARSQLHIVSVGRLVNFKAYNLGAPRIVAALRERGVPVTWDIYGAGPLLGEIEEEIERFQVNDAVHLKGELAYTDFQTTIASYDIFLGMGTAALEAAMIGLPTICATDSQRDNCYGFVHELPFGNVGEPQSFPPSVGMLELITDFARSDQAVRTKQSAMCRAAAMKYEMGGFIAQLEAIHRQRLNKPSRIFKRTIAWLYRMATESAGIRLLRSVKRGAK